MLSCLFRSSPQLTSIRKICARKFTDPRKTHVRCETKSVQMSSPLSGERGYLDKSFSSPKCTLRPTEGKGVGMMWIRLHKKGGKEHKSLLRGAPHASTRAKEIGKTHDVHEQHTQRTSPPPTCYSTHEYFLCPISWVIYVMQIISTPTAMRTMLWWDS